jgi:hypothetical protein
MFRAGLKAYLASHPRVVGCLQRTRWLDHKGDHSFTFNAMEFYFLCGTMLRHSDNFTFTFTTKYNTEEVL